MSNTNKQSKRKEGLKEMKDLMTNRHPLNPKNLAKDAALAGSTISSALAATKSNNPKVKATAGAATAKLMGKKVIHDVKYVGDWLNAARKILFNHPEWYTKYGSLNSSNLQWAMRKQSMLNDEIAAGVRYEYGLSVPMQKGHVSRAYLDAMNMIFAKLRGSNSGAYNYTVDDLADYIEVARSIYAVSSCTARDIALLNNVDILSANSPDIILRIAGLTANDIADLRVNRANYIDRLNRLNLTIANLIPLPPQLAYFDRTVYMAQLVLKDSDTSKALPICTRLTDVYMVNTANDGLSHTGVDSNIGLRLELISKMIDGFNHFGGTTPTFAKIAGDMLKAYGDSAFRPYLALTNFDSVSITYDPYLLTQIQNCNTATMLLDGFFDDAGKRASKMTYKTSFTLSGINNGTRRDYYFATDIPGCICTQEHKTSSMLINNYKDDCSEGEALSLTRLCTVLNFPKDQINVGEEIEPSIYCCGSEVIFKTAFVYYEHTDVNGLNGINESYVNVSGDTSELNYPDTMLTHTLWAQVDWAPTLYLPYPETKVQAVNKPLRMFTKMIDLNVTATLTPDQLENFTEAATLSMLKTIDINEQLNFRSSK